MSSIITRMVDFAATHSPHSAGSRGVQGIIQKSRNPHVSIFVQASATLSLLGAMVSGGCASQLTPHEKAAVETCAANPVFAYGVPDWQQGIVDDAQSICDSAAVCFRQASVPFSDTACVAFLKDSSGCADSLTSVGIPSQDAFRSNVFLTCVLQSTVLRQAFEIGIKAGRTPPKESGVGGGQTDPGAGGMSSPGNPG